MIQVVLIVPGEPWTKGSPAGTWWKSWSAWCCPLCHWELNRWIARCSSSSEWEGCDRSRRATWWSKHWNREGALRLRVVSCLVLCNFRTILICRRVELVGDVDHDPNMSEPQKFRTLSFDVSVWAHKCGSFMVVSSSIGVLTYGRTTSTSVGDHWMRQSVRAIVVVNNMSLPSRACPLWFYQRPIE